MTTKIPVTKFELLEIANLEFSKEPLYRQHLKITDIEIFGTGLKFVVLAASESDILPIIESQALAKRLEEKYIMIG